MTRYPPRSVGSGRPVFGIDIDGTLGRYHEHFLRYAEGWLGRELPAAQGFSGDRSLAAYMGISKTTYRKIKLGYRRGGLKRSMPVYPGAQMLVRGLRDRGATIAICTTRPFLQLEAVEDDTLFWLRRNKIPFDRVFSGEHKYVALAKSFPSHEIVGVVEDLPEMTMQAHGQGLLTWMPGRPYNDGIYDLEDITVILHNHLDDWEKTWRK